MITTNVVKTSMEIPALMILNVKDSGSTKLEVIPGGGLAAAIVDSGESKALVADNNPI